MRSSSTSNRLALLALACGLPLAALSCRKPRVQDIPSGPVAEVAPELLSNALAHSVSPMLQAQAQSQIHWQPWSQETFQRAGKANRLVFAVIAHPQQVDYRRVLAAMEANPGIVHEINASYVPVLIDADLFREMGLLAPVICSETKQRLRLPLFVWFTHAGHLVTATSVNPDANNVGTLFDQTHGIVGQLWESSHDYVLSNSAADHAERAARLARAATPPPNLIQADAESLTSIRKLSTLYDPLSHTFDNTGGIFPSSSLELFATAALAPQLSADLRQRAVDTSDGLSRDLSASPMIDPLDGGVFAARSGNTWNLPVFSRDCSTQARAALALFEASRTPGNPVLLEQARAAIQFAEANYGTPDGLFAMGLDEPRSPAAWLWKLDRIDKILSPSQARLWSLISAWRQVGNVAIEDDPKRDFLYLNRLSMSVPLQQAAEKLGISPEDARREFDDSRQSLLAVRNRRMPASALDRTPQATASFRMVSAYASAFTATGEPVFRERAVATLAKTRERFARGNDLRPYADAVPPAEGRAFLYALAMQAALDVADITLDNAHADWAGQLATTVTERFIDGTALLEAPKDQNPIGLPLTNRTMLFEESTAGLLSACEARLIRRGLTVPRPLEEAVASLPADIQRAPVAHVDLLLASLLRHHGVTVAVDNEAPAELKDAVAGLPFRLFARATATPANPAPAKTARVRFADGREAIVSTPKELVSAIQAGGPQP